MSEEAPKVATTTTPVSSSTTVGATTTREQHRKNAAAELEAIDDGEKNQNENKKKDKEIFKGKVDKMGGNVFQLAEENRRGNQFTQTLEALCDYTIIELEHAKDLAPLFEIPSKEAKIKEPSDQPPLLADGSGRVGRDHRLYIAWKFECESYNTRVVSLQANLNKIFTVTLLQCSPSVKSKLEGTSGYEDAKSKHDCKWLLTTLRNICHKFEHTENRFVALVNAKAALFNYRQGSQQTTTDYYEGFKEILTVLESFNGKVHDPVAAAPDSAVGALALLADAVEKDAYMRDRYTAVLFIRNADNHRFTQLKTELSNDFSKGRDEYPKTLVEAHQLLLTYKGGIGTPAKATPENTSRRNRGRQGRGKNTGRGGGPNGNTNQQASGAPNSGQTGRSFVQVAFSLAQVDNHFPDGIPNHFVLLDSDSTVSIFCNPLLLTNIHDVDEPLHLETNGGGHQVTTQMGTLDGFGPVWYNPESIANVLSLAQVRRVRRVTMDTAVSPTFQVHRIDGTGTTDFIEHESGLYLYDASAVQKQVNTVNLTSILVVFFRHFICKST